MIPSSTSRCCRPRSAWTWPTSGPWDRGGATASGWQSLLAAGVAPEDAERLHSPIGLDLGAVTPAEVAVSITAELVAARSRSARGLSLKHGSGPIHPYANTPHHQETPWT